MNDHAFAIGVNYWDSKSGTDMWKNWDRETVEADFAALEAVGVRYLRVFPNWRDFQPIHKQYQWGKQVPLLCIRRAGIPDVPRC